MPTKKAAAPELHLRDRQERESQREAGTALSHGIMHQSGPSVHIRHRSPLVPALVLGFIAFSVCFLAGHVLAAIVGWHWMIYVGTGLGLWFFASCIVAFCVGAVCDDD